MTKQEMTRKNLDSFMLSQWEYFMGYLKFLEEKYPGVYHFLQKHFVVFINTLVATFNQAEYYFKHRVAIKKSVSSLNL
jgi:hypothetical protein